MHQCFDETSQRCDNNLYSVWRDVLYQILKSTRLLSKPSQKPAFLGQSDYSMDSVTAVPSVLRSGILIVTLWDFEISWMRWPFGPMIFPWYFRGTVHSRVTWASCINAIQKLTLTCSTVTWHKTLSNTEPVGISGTGFFTGQILFLTHPFNSVKALKEIQSTDFNEKKKHQLASSCVDPPLEAYCSFMAAP